MIADVQMFADPHRKEQLRQTNLPFVIPEDETPQERRLASRTEKQGSPPQTLQQASKKRFTPRNFIKEARAELKALDIEIKRLESLKSHRAEVARMLEAAKQIATEKKPAKPLRAIA